MRHPPPASISARPARFLNIQVVLLALILGLAAGLRAWGITFGLPNSDVRPDETTMIQVSLGLLFAGLNPRYFLWPSLEFYVMAAIYRIAWEVEHFRGLFRLKFDMFRDAMLNPVPYLLVPVAISLAAGVVTVWLVYRITRELFDKSTALVASFFIAVAYLHVRDSHFGVTDVPMTALAMGALLLLSRATADPLRLRRWVVAGTMVGLTASTKYNGGVMVAVGLIAVAAGVRVPGEPWLGRTAMRSAIGFLAAALLGFLAGTPFAVLDYPAFAEGLRFQSNHLVTGHGIDLGRGWGYHLMFSLRYGLGAPLLIAGLAGMPILAARSWQKAALVCAFPITYYLLLGSGTAVFVRYMIPMVPFLCITAAIAVMALANRLVPRTPSAKPWIAAAVAVLIAQPSIQRVIAFDSLITKTDTRLLASRWLDPQIASEEWVSETPDGIVHPVWGRPPSFRAARFDEQRQLFVSDTGDVVVPDWIVLATSPLSVYTTVPPHLLPIIESSYSLVATFPSTTAAERPSAFDQQDKFFVPYVEFAARIRPGPDIQIYRRSLPPRSARSSPVGAALKIGEPGDVKTSD